MDILAMQIEDDVFSMPLRTESEILARYETLCGRVLRNRAAGLALLVVIIVAARVVSGGNPSVIVWTALVTAFSIGFIVASCRALDKHLFVPSSAWLEDEDCEELATLCENYPGLMPFRDWVRETGRRFAFEEFEAMQMWADCRAPSAKHRRGYERLYGRTLGEC
jgi:hypothetical protein